MWITFSLENLFFALHVFAGLTFFSVAWLYFDAWKETKVNREVLKVFGFIILGASFLIRGVEMRDIQIFQNLDVYIRNAGYLLLIIGLLVDPLQPKPKNLIVLAFGTISLFFVSPILAGVVAVLYLRRASVGLERHLYPPAISFFLISFYELVFSLNNFRETDNLNIFNLLAPYGPVWIFEIVILVVAIIFIGRWVFKYLLKQFESQLFMVLMGLVLGIYLIVTVGFTGLLLNNLKSQILQELISQSKVLEFAFNAKKDELLATARLASSSSDIKSLETTSSLTVFDENGVVTFRSDDNERKGDSVSGDKLVKRVLVGKNDSNIVVRDGVIAPIISIVSGSPIITDGKVTGGVLVEEVVDDLYLEGFSKTTNLKAAIYGGNILSAGGQVGILEDNQKIKELVLTKGEIFALENKWLNSRFLSVYAPLKDVEGNVIGMYFVGRPQVEVLNIASKTLEMIFIGVITLLFLSMIPAKIIANSIAKQVK